MPRRRRLLDDLLVAALHGAVALAQIHGVAVGVGQHLELDVARVFQELLHIHHGIAECRLRFALGHGDGVQERRLGVHHAHAASAAAAGGLDDHRIADAARDLDDSRRDRPAARRQSPARTARRPLFMACLALTLSPIMRMVSGRGPMNTKPLFSTRSAKSAFSDRKP